MWIAAFGLSLMLAHTVTCFRIGIISNVIFIPYNSSGKVIVTNQSCLACGCYAKQQNYSGFNCFSNNKTCSLFPTDSVRYDLNTTINASFYFFQLPLIKSNFQTTTNQAAAFITTQSIVYRNLTSENDSVVGIWNATKGGDSLVATVGRSNGQYPNVSEGPANVQDYNLWTKYNSYGSANTSITLPQPGVGTGFCVTMAVGACIVTGIQFATANDKSERDPITMTLEGSNVTNSSLLSKGSSWTLIYSGPTGISMTPIPSRTIYVPPQNFTNTNRFTSYR